MNPPSLSSQNTAQSTSAGKFNDGDEPVVLWFCPHATANKPGLSTLSLQKKYFFISQPAQIIKLLKISNYCASPVSAAALSGEDPEENSSLSSWGQPPAHLDVLQEDAPTPLVLQLHQLLSVLPLLVRLMQEVLGKVFQGHIIPVKIVGLKNKEFTGSKPLLQDGCSPSPGQQGSVEQLSP